MRRSRPDHENAAEVDQVALEDGSGAPGAARRVLHVTGRVRNPLIAGAVAVASVFALVFASAGPAQAATTFVRTGLGARVTGSTVAVWAEVRASSAVVVRKYQVCVRDADGRMPDFEPKVGVTLTPAGVEYYKSGKRFSPGTYSYYACVQTSAGWRAVGGRKSFTVVRTASSTASITGLPAVPQGYTRKVGENFGRQAALGQFASVYGSDWAGAGASSTTTRTTANDNGRYRPDKVLSTRSQVGGASDGNALDIYLHSATLSDDDVAGPTALSAAPRPLGWRGLTCGRFSIRYRADTVDGFKHAHLLWPESANWNDGEIDFVENEQLGMSPFWAVHIPGTYGTSFSGRLVRDARGGQEHGTVPAANENGWHVATIDLKPGAVKFEWDGEVVGQATGVGENGKSYPNHGVPTKPMVFVLQTETETWDGSNPSPSAAGHEQIDWVTVDAC